MVFYLLVAVVVLVLITWAIMRLSLTLAAMSLSSVPQLPLSRCFASLEKCVPMLSKPHPLPQ